MAAYDVVVVGLGAMGSATCWQLARRGKRVLGLDRYDIPNAMGSSHGVNRVIRLAYFEHPSYVPILRRAYELWRETETLAGEQLLWITGSLDIGVEGGAIVEGSLASCRQHGLPHEALRSAEVRARFPGYVLPADFVAVHQPEGGFVASERAIVAACNLAMAKGAVLRAREAVLGFERLPGGGVRVETERGRYEAGQVVIAAGAWVGALAPDLAALAVPERQVLGWFRPKVPEHFALGRFPVSNLKSEEHGHFYQFPVWSVPGFKIGLYHHLRQQGAPETLSREPTREDEAALRRGLAAFFPEADGDVMALRTCMFTNTPDEHFILDRLPDFEEVIVASPCSGHGFKFSSAIGEILADMACARPSPLDLSLFSLTRFSGGLTAS